MASFTQNISNTVQVFGKGPSTKWGGASSFTTMVWGTSTWGEGESLPLTLTKTIDFQSIITSFTHSNSVDFNRTISVGSISPTFEMSSEELTNGIWAYVYPSSATDGEERDFASWTSATLPDVTFSCQAVAATSWSEVT